MSQTPTNDAPAAATPAPAPVSPSVAIAPRPLANAALGTWATEANFALALRASKALAASDLVPEAYKGKEANCLIAIDISYHLGISPLTVMQNLHIIHGRPSWGSPFVIGLVNTSGRFSPLRFEVTRRGRKKVEVTTWVGPKGNRTPSKSMVEIDDTECYAYATEIATGQRVDGPPVSIEMATAEGWVDKAESKWKTMPDLMLRYRAAAFFGRLYAPDSLMGMPTVDEVHDIEKPGTVTATAKTAGAASLQEAISQMTEAVADVVAVPMPGEQGAEPAPEVVDAKPAPVVSEPAPVPSKFCAKALEKEAAGAKLSEEEAESIRNHRLDLTEWESRQPQSEDK